MSPPRSREPSAPGPTARPLRFGPFVLDREASLLLRRGVAVRLPTKAWRVLCHLAARPGALVTPDDLLDAVWEGAAVSRQCVTNAVREVRRALGDRARSPRWLETVHGRGFRFLAGAPAPSDRSRPAAAGGFFVGREAELAALHDGYADATRRRAVLVLVTGDPGIGKTALAEAFLASLPTRGVHAPAIARGYAADQHGRIEPYMPLLEAFGVLARSDRRARGTFGRLAPTWAVHVPGTLAAARRVEIERSVRGASAARMVREGVAALSAVTRQRPLVLLLEDVHWADDATADFIVAVARRVVQARLLMVLTCRPVAGDRVAAALAELTLRGSVRVLRLAPFGDAEVRSYLAARFADEALAGTLAPALGRSSAGNPLVLRSAAEQLVEEGIVVANASAWRLARPLPAATAGVPRPLAELVDAVVAAGGETRRAVLEAAATVGTEFTVEEVARCLGGSSRAVAAECAALARDGRLVRAVGQAVWPDGATSARYAFAHDLYRQHLYERVPAARRRAHHRAAAAVLRARFAADLPAVAARVATHLCRAGDRRGAIEAFARAADAAERRFAYREGAEYVRAALATARELPPTDGRARREATLALQLGALLVLAEGYSTAAVEQAYRTAWDHAERLGDRRLRFAGGAGLAAYHMTKACYAAARPLVEEMLEIATSTAPRLVPFARCWAGILAAATGNLQQAREHLEEGARHDPAPGMPRYFDLRRMIDSQLGCVLVVLGDAERGVARAVEAARRSRRTGTAADATHAAVLAAEAAILAGNRGRARELSAAARALAEENAMPTYGAMAAFYEAWTVAPEEPARAVVGMEAALAERRRLGDRWQESALLGWLAGEEIARGQLERARRRLDEAFAFVAASGERYFEAELHRLRGDLVAAARGPWAEEAAVDYRVAVAVAREQGATLWQTRAEGALPLGGANYDAAASARK